MGALCWASAAFLLAGCGGDETVQPTPSGPPEVDPAALAHTQAGWDVFESGDYSGALTSFGAALATEPKYTDALSGQGWSYMRLDSLTLAAASFDSAVAYGEYWQDNSAYVGALLGQALGASVRGDHVLAAAAGDRAAELGGEFYVFPHDNSITVDHARLVVAEAYVRLGYYYQAYLQLVEIDITVLNRVDRGSELFVQEVLAELSRLSLSL